MEIFSNLVTYHIVEFLATVSISDVYNHYDFNAQTNNRLFPILLYLMLKTSKQLLVYSITIILAIKDYMRSLINGACRRISVKL